jgi:hypothetical protein
MPCCAVLCCAALLPAQQLRLARESIDVEDEPEEEGGDKDEELARRAAAVRRRRKPGGGSSSRAGSSRRGNRAGARPPGSASDAGDEEDAAAWAAYSAEDLGAMAPSKRLQTVCRSVFTVLRRHQQLPPATELCNGGKKPIKPALLQMWHVVPGAAEGDEAGCGCGGSCAAARAQLAWPPQLALVDVQQISYADAYPDVIGWAQQQLQPRGPQWCAGEMQALLDKHQRAQELYAARQVWCPTRQPCHQGRLLCMHPWVVLPCSNTRCQHAVHRCIASQPLPTCLTVWQPLWLLRTPCAISTHMCMTEPTMWCWCPASLCCVPHAGGQAARQRWEQLRSCCSTAGRGGDPAACCSTAGTHHRGRRQQYGGRRGPVSSSVQGTAGRRARPHRSGSGRDWRSCLVRVTAPSAACSD